MPSHSVPIKHNRVFLPVLVLDPERGLVGDWDHHEFVALVDTGATTSMIAQRVVQRLEFAIIGTDKFIPATGVPTETTLHRVALAVPTETEHNETSSETTFTIQDGVLVLKMPKPLQGFDVVIGMDVLMDFHIQIHNGVFTISRRGGPTPTPPPHED